MAVRTILTMEHPVLRAKAKKVSRFDAYLERLVADMWETMRDAPGVGLAAPQIGESLRVLVAEFEDEQVTLVNPEIVKRNDEIELGTEGCLSIPGYVGDHVPRATTVTVKGRDARGKEIRVRAEGWFARILQHEIDHLDGILYIDHIRPEDVREVTDDDVESEGGPETPKDQRAAKSEKSAKGGTSAGEKKAPARATAANGAQAPSSHGKPTARTPVKSVPHTTARQAARGGSAR
ncbi:MAG TPA: peptide deformylase [Ktedonobacterales bacterium]|nr:peptide deformylase [Ktedonobacterales bacterium]